MPPSHCNSQQECNLVYFVGAWKAVRQAFPNVSIKGCAFHFGQAVWRKVQELGLKTTYSQRGAEYRYIRTLMALPFLPHADIEPAFEVLSERANSTELKNLVGYIRLTWFEGAYWTPRTWSIYQHSIRTNNDVEGVFLISRELCSEKKYFGSLNLNLQTMFMRQIIT